MASRSPRDPYPVVGAAGRAAIKTMLAVVPKPGGFEWRVFVVVIAKSVLFSRLEDTHYLGHIAAEVHHVERASERQIQRTREALKLLADIGAIVREAPRGRPPEKGQPAYTIGVHAPSTTKRSTEEIHPESVVHSSRKSTPNPCGNPPRIRAEIHPESGGPTEKDSENDADRRRLLGSQSTTSTGATGRPPAVTGDGAAADTTTRWRQIVCAHLELPGDGYDADAELVAAFDPNDPTGDVDTLQLAIAAATARHTGDPPQSHLADTDAEEAARYLIKHHTPDVIYTALRHANGWAIDEDDDVVEASTIDRPADIAHLALHIQNRRLPFGHDTPRHKPPKATSAAKRSAPDHEQLLRRFTGGPFA